MIQLSFPPGAVPVLALICWVPCFLLGFLETNWKVPVWAWFATAFVNWLIHTWPLQYYPIEAFGQPVLTSRFLLAAAAWWSSIPYAAAAFVSHKWLANGSRPGRWLPPVVFTVLSGIWPVPFPGGMHLALYRVPWVFQWAEVGGSMALNFWIFLTSFLIARGIHATLSERILPGSVSLQLLAVLAIILIPGALRYGCWCEREDLAIENQEVFRAALVQPALPAPGINRERVPFPENYRRNDIWLIPISNTAKASHPDLQLVVWPEVPIPVGYGSDPKRKAMIDTWLATFRKPLLFCSTEKKSDSRDGGPDFEMQTMHLLTPDGKHQQAAKKLLIPFSEYLPLEDQIPVMRKIFPNVNRFKRGTEWTSFVLGPVQLGPMVCYEDMFPEIARKWKKEGANILVSLSNDSWFGDTRMQEIRLAAGMLCAIETRLPWLRCENAGYTLACLPSGRLLEKRTAPLFKRAFVFVEAPLVTENQAWRIPATFFMLLIMSCMLMAGWIECWVFNRSGLRAK